MTHINLGYKEKIVKIVVYFENGMASDVVAQFATEKMYMACLPVLEELAGNEGYIVTESMREHEEVSDAIDDDFDMDGRC
jgi:hypothetical protein